MIEVPTEAGTVRAEPRSWWAVLVETAFLMCPPGGDWRITYVTTSGLSRTLDVTGSRYQSEQDARAWARHVDALGEAAFLQELDTWRCRGRRWQGLGPASIDR